MERVEDERERERSGSLKQKYQIFRVYATTMSATEGILGMAWPIELHDKRQLSSF